MDRHQSLSLNVTVSSGSVVALSVCLLSYSAAHDEIELNDSVVLPCSIPVIDSSRTFTVSFAVTC